ncbi:MAG: GatB/YqeY domain-containing protein [Patescibacteria group bacterium]
MQEKIKDKIKEAMLAKDTVARDVYRGISAAFVSEVMAKGKTPQDPISDEDAMIVLKRLAKQRKDSIDQFTKGGRPELAASEQAELAIIETLLPKMMAREEILKIAEAKKSEMNVTDKSKMGILMGAVMKETKGAADGADVKAVVESLFA